MADALFEPGDGPDVWVPTERSRGPWSPLALHGGPTSAFLARACEQEPAEQPMQPARLTVELLRPVPLAPLTLTTRLVRPGRKVQLVEASLAHEGRDVARAVLL